MNHDRGTDESYSSSHLINVWISLSLWFPPGALSDSPSYVKRISTEVNDDDIPASEEEEKEGLVFFQVNSPDGHVQFFFLS